MPKIWWCIHICLSLISSFSHFFKCSVDVHLHVRTIFFLRSMMWDPCFSKLQHFENLFFRSPLWWGILCVHVLLIYALCCIDPWLMIDAGSCYFMLSQFHASCYAESFIWCTFCHKSLCYALRSLIACCWDTLVVIMHVFCFYIPFVPCWHDVYHACFVSYW